MTLQPTGFESIFGILASAGLLAAASIFERVRKIKPPLAREIPSQSTLHGDLLTDNYAWLTDRSNPEVMAYLEAENRFTAEVMKPVEGLQEKLFQEMLARIKEDNWSPPVRIGHYLYFNRSEKGKPHSIMCRRKDEPSAPEEIIIDNNVLAEGHRYYSLGFFRVSPDQQLFAYAVDTTGSESHTLYIKDLRTGSLFPETIFGVAGAVEWGNDNRTLFYTVLNDSLRPYRLYRHVMGTAPSQDEMIYEEKDPTCYLFNAKTKDNRYLLLRSGSNLTAEMHYLSADTPLESFRLIKPRRAGVDYAVENIGDKFYILTNERAGDFKVVVAPIENPAPENWLDFLPHREAVLVDGYDAFRNHLVVYEREAGLKRIRVIDIRTNEFHYIDFPEPTYSLWSSGNREFNTSLLRYMYCSMVAPIAAYDYDMNTRERVLVKQYEVMGGHDPEQYHSERIFAIAPDGAKIPISLVYKKGIKRDGQSPLLLYAYGAYGMSAEPFFISDRLSLLDRGVIYAIAHVRGGDELGHRWYEQGRLKQKRNSFTDFIACAEHLLAENYTSPERLVISGGSAGGLLVGAVINLRPDLFCGAVATAPFVDILNSMLDPAAPLTAGEYEEWGDPARKEDYEYIKSYAPYENVTARKYPALLVTSGLNDQRVQYWQPARWVAKLRALKTDNNILLLKMNIDSGHSGVSGRYAHLRDTAFDYAFLLSLLDIAD